MDRERLETLSPLENAVDTILNSPEHIWHGADGIVRGGKYVRPSKPERKAYIAKKKAGEPTPGWVGPGMFAPAAERMYKKILEVFQQDNELGARMGTWALLKSDHKDLKVLLAALLLVQDRFGEPVTDEEETFFDDDFRDVGAAMFGYYMKGGDWRSKVFSPKMILRIHEILTHPAIAAMNKEAGFGDPDSKRPFLGRWTKSVHRWLLFRERNPKMLEGLVKGGMKNMIIHLAELARYKPESENFFRILGKRQKQHTDGHRTIGLNLEVKTFTFDGMSEPDIAEAIVDRKMGYKQVVGMLPADIGLTPLIMRACVPQMSDKDLIIATPTLEDLGLLKVASVKRRLAKALKNADDERARNIALNIRNREVKAQLEAAAEGALAKQVEKSLEDMDVQIGFHMDISSSMDSVTDVASNILKRILPAFSKRKDDVFLSVFNTNARRVVPKAFTAAGVQTALKGLRASGGTRYSSTVQEMIRYGFVPKPGKNMILFYIGDEADENGRSVGGKQLTRTFRDNKFIPSAIVLIPVVSDNAYWKRGDAVRSTSQALDIPLTEGSPDMIPDRDPYQLARFLRTVLAASASDDIPKEGAGFWEPKLIKELLGMELLSTTHRAVCMA